MEKKVYSKFAIKKVKLLVDELVLAACKNPNTAIPGKNQAKCPGAGCKAQGS